MIKYQNNEALNRYTNRRYYTMHIYPTFVSVRLVVVKARGVHGEVPTVHFPGLEGANVHSAAVDGRLDNARLVTTYAYIVYI